MWIVLYLTVNLLIHPTAKVSEEVNRKCPARNTTEKISTRTPTLSEAPKCTVLQTDRQTDDSVMPRVDHTACSRLQYDRLQTFVLYREIDVTVVTIHSDSGLLINYSN